MYSALVAGVVRVYILSLAWAFERTVSCILGLQAGAFRRDVWGMVFSVRVGRRVWVERM